MPAPRRIALPPQRHDGVEEAPVTLSVHDAGEGPAVVLSHGFPELAYSWRHQIGPLVDAGYRVIVPDQRGYGASDSPAGVPGRVSYRSGSDSPGRIPYARPSSDVVRTWTGVMVDSLPSGLGSLRDGRETGTQPLAGPPSRCRDGRWPSGDCHLNGCAQNPIDSSMNSLVTRSAGVMSAGKSISAAARASITSWIRASSMLPTVLSGPLPASPRSSCVATEKSASSAG